MTNERQIERLLDSWFAEGPTLVPDRAIDGVAARISRQHQRPAWRLLPWRFPTVNTSLKLLLIGGAVVAAVAAGAILVAGGRGQTAMVAPTPALVATVAPTPTVGPTPTVAPTATPMPRGNLEPGTYVTHPIAGDALTWQVSVPSGWTNTGEWFIYPTALHGPDGTDASGTRIGAAVAFVNRPQVFTDPCDFGTMTHATTVAELVAAIQAENSWVVGAPVDVRISGFDGQQVDVALPATSPCGKDYQLAIGSTGTENGFHQQGPSQRLRLWILDLGDRIVLLARETFPATPNDRAAEAQAIIESSVIAP